MAKVYKKGFKIYFNDRLKTVDFHGEPTLPLYIQVVYRSKNLIFKSYLFDLLSSSRYNIKQKTPKLADIILFETKTFEFISGVELEIDRLDQLQLTYNYYSTDLCTTSEEAYLVQLQFVLKDMGYEYLAVLFNKMNNEVPLYYLMQDFLKMADKNMADLIVKAMDSAGQPYLYLYEFVLNSKMPPYYFLSVREWQQLATKTQFWAFLEHTYPEKAKDIVKSVDRWIKTMSLNLNT